MLNVAFPGNAKFFYDALKWIATFKVFEMKSLKAFAETQQQKDYEICWEDLSLTKIQREHPCPIRGQQPIKPLFAENGYGSHSIIRNMGILALAAIFFVLIGLVLIVAVFFIKDFMWRTKQRRDVLRWFWFSFFWSVPIRYVMQIYLSLSISALINFQVQTWGPWEDTLNSWGNILMLFGLGLFCFWVFYVVTKNYGKLEKPMFNRRFGTLYFNVNINHEFNILITCVFCLRRIIYALIIVFLNPWPAIQLMAMLAHCSFTMGYIMCNRPFKLPLLNGLEFLNEASITLIVYHLLAFTDFVGNPETQFKVGYSIIVVTGVNIVVNLGFMVVNCGSKVYLQAKHFYLSWKLSHAKRKAELVEKRRQKLEHELEEISYSEDEFIMHRQKQAAEIRARSIEVASMISSHRADLDSPKELLP